MDKLNREELELLAKVAGVELEEWLRDGIYPILCGPDKHREWNPATNAEDLVGLYLACMKWCANDRVWSEKIEVERIELFHAERSGDRTKWAEAVCRLGIEIGRIA